MMKSKISRQASAATADLDWELLAIWLILPNPRGLFKLYHYRRYPIFALLKAVVVEQEQRHAQLRRFAMSIPIYQLALFVHILGAFGLVAAITLEASAQWGLRRAATAEEARARLAGVRVIQRLAPASLGSILLTGLYMMAVAWGPKGWIVAALAGL